MNMMYSQQEPTTTTYEQQQLLRELGCNVGGWMENATNIPEADTLDEAIEMLAEDGGDTYEVVVRIHLLNDMVIELHNRCFENVTNLHMAFYKGDEIRVYDMDDNYACTLKGIDREGALFKPLIELLFTDKDGNFHQSSLPVSQIRYVDSFSVELDWKQLWKQLSHEERETRRKAWLEYWAREKEKQKSKND